MTSYSLPVNGHRSLISKMVTGVLRDGICALYYGSDMRRHCTSSNRATLIFQEMAVAMPRVVLVLSNEFFLLLLYRIYRIYRICGILFLVILKFTITKLSILKIL